MKPTIQGSAGKAWNLERAPKPDDPPDWQGALAQWLIYQPGVNAFWSYWRMDLIHLRPIEGVRPAHKHYPEAEYEMIFVALDPDSTPNPAYPDTCARFLDPPDLVYQFHGLNDVQAKHLLELAVRYCCDGGASPDSDWRSRWRDQILPNTIEHIKNPGSHGHGVA